MTLEKGPPSGQLGGHLDENAHLVTLIAVRAAEKSPGSIAD